MINRLGLYNILFIILIFIGCSGGGSGTGGGVIPAVATPTTAVIPTAIATQISLVPGQDNSVSLSDGTEIKFPAGSVTSPLSVKVDVSGKLYNLTITRGDPNSYISDSATIQLNTGFNKLLSSETSEYSINTLYESGDNQVTWNSSAISVNSSTVQTRITRLPRYYKIIETKNLSTRGNLITLEKIFGAKKGTTDIVEPDIAYNDVKSEVRYVYPEVYKKTITVPQSYRTYIGGDLMADDPVNIRNITPSVNFIGLVLVFDETGKDLIRIISLSMYYQRITWHTSLSAHIGLSGEILPYDSMKKRTYYVKIYALAGGSDFTESDMGNIFLYTREIPYTIITPVY